MAAVQLPEGTAGVKTSFSSKLLLLRVYERQIRRRIAARQHQGNLTIQEAEDGLEWIKGTVASLHPDEPNPTIDMVAVDPIVVNPEPSTPMPTPTTAPDPCSDSHPRLVFRSAYYIYIYTYIVISLPSSSCSSLPFFSSLYPSFLFYYCILS